jgi:beta-lactamase regulating signal transducer with metallopeptidase domain
MLGILLAWRALESATRPVRPSSWEPADNDVDMIGGLVLLALLIAVLLIGAAVLVIWALGGLVVVTARMVTRTTRGGE